MAFIPPRDRVAETSTSNSQSVFALAGALDTSYNAFSASMAVGDTTIGGVVEAGVAFKSGILTYSATNQITVSTVKESKGTFSSGGTKHVFMGLPGLAALMVDGAQSLTSTQKSQAKANLKISGPTVTVLTSGTGATYNTPTGCTRIRVRGVGGGGGNATSAGAAGDGGTTSFAGAGITTMTATGGAKGTGQGGGAAAGGVGANGQINYAGGVGMGCFTMVGFCPGHLGGNTFLFPCGEVGGANATANTGHGAGETAKNFGSSGSTIGCGAGGGGFERWIDAPAASYTYTIGAGGTAGTGGWAGGSGVIVIEEFYD